MVIYLVEVRRGIRHVSFTWGIDHRSRYEKNFIEEDEVIGEFEVFVQKVQPLEASGLQSISHKEKWLFHWYILKNMDEIAEYCKYAFLPWSIHISIWQ